MTRTSFGSYATLSNTGRLPLVLGDEARGRAVRRICRVGGNRLLLFAVADDHVHLVVREVGSAALHLFASIEQALVRGDGTPPLDDRLIKQIYTRSYLENLVRYHCTQGAHHGIPGIDLSGGCLLDLLGARCLPGFDRSWTTELLPRMDEAALLDLVGFPPVPGFTLAHVVEPNRLVAAGSLLIGLDLRAGRSPEVAGARRAILDVALQAHGEYEPTARALGITDRAARRLLAAPPPARVAAALRRLLALGAAEGVRPSFGATRSAGRAVGGTTIL